MGGLSPWHWLILLAIFAVIVGGIAGAIVLLMKVVSKSNKAHPYSQRADGLPASTAPGWYPDPNQPDLMRYFDGQVWTSSTQSRN